MSDWGGGYITDITYTAGYYATQSPWHIALCATLAGFEVDMPGPDDRLSYLELGCGTGYGALQLAAANPGWIVTAIDFNPAHIAMARRLAKEADLANVTFIEGDLSTLAEDAAVMASLPDADVVTMHGVWSWVASAVQQGIVRLLKARVKPGGLVQLSYNALPAWQNALALQRLVRETGRRLPIRSDRQANAGLELAKTLFDAEARHMRMSPIAADMVENFTKMRSNYLAHEFMNGNWTPCFHADVAEAMSGARLNWAGSANLTENFPELTLNDAQREAMLRYEDPLMRELIKDTCIDRGFRSDIFVRGAVRVSGAGRDAALGEMVVGLTVAPEDFSYELDVPVGKLTMNQAFYGAVARTLGHGPARIADLAALSDKPEGQRNPAELISMLIGSGQAELVARPGAGPGAAALRLNAVTARRFVDPARVGEPFAVASARLGAGLRCRGLELFLLDRIAAVGGWIDPAPWVAELAPGLDAEDAEKLRGTMIRVAEQRTPAWRLAGLI